MVDFEIDLCKNGYELKNAEKGRDLAIHFLNNNAIEGVGHTYRINLDINNVALENKVNIGTINFNHQETCQENNERIYEAINTTNHLSATINDQKQVYVRYKNNLPDGFQSTEFKNLHLGSETDGILWTSYEDCCPYFIDVDLNSYINPENKHFNWVEFHDPSNPSIIVPDVVVPFEILASLSLGRNMNVFFAHKDLESTLKYPTMRKSDVVSLMYPEIDYSYDPNRTVPHNGKYIKLGDFLPPIFIA